MQKVAKDIQKQFVIKKIFSNVVTLSATELQGSWFKKITTSNNIENTQRADKLKSYTVKTVLIQDILFC